MRCLSLTALMFAFLFAPRVATAQSIEALQKSLSTTADPANQAKLQKQLGDAWMAEDNLDRAAEAYMKALATGRENFSPSERLRMAIYLSWADRLTDSEVELRHLLRQDPRNVAARTHL